MNLENDQADQTAPWYTISENDVMSIEHPCIVKNSHKAIETLGGAQQLAQSLETGTEQTLGLVFNPKDVTSRAILSIHNETNNILLKVTLPKRTGRKRKRGSNDDYLETCDSMTEHRDASTLLHDLQQNAAKYHVEAIGCIKSVHVWRSMPDFTYTTKSSSFMKKVETHILPQQYPLLKQWSLPRTYGLEDTETLPPPVLSTQSLSTNYTYRQNPAVKTIADPSTGGRVLHNTALPLKVYIASCLYDDPSYPTEPLPECPPLETQTTHIQELVSQMRKIFHKQPILTRRALTNGLPLELPIFHIRNAVGYVAYNIRSGPWRDTYCAFGLDPRTDPKYRIYQTVVVKLAPKDKGSSQNRVPVQRLWQRSTDIESHIFTGTKPAPLDGKVWQLCHLQDPVLKQLVEVPELYIRAQCEPRYFGWYMNGTNAKIRVLLKAKIDALAEKTSLDSDMVESFLRLPELWVPRIKDSDEHGDEPAAGYMPEKSTGKALEWASAYRSMCRTSFGSLPNFGSSGKGRVSKPKPKARPSYIDPNLIHDEFETFDRRNIDPEAEDDGYPEAEVERDAEVAAQYQEPEDDEDGEDDDDDDDDEGDDMLSGGEDEGGQTDAA